MPDKVLVARTGSILRVTLNRPEKKNALDGEMYEAIRVAFERAGEDPAVRVILLAGAGDAFTAGNDLKDFASWEDFDSPAQVPVVRLIRTLIDFDKPIVAAVRGAAVGFGTTVLLHCDVVVVSDTSKFSLPFVRLALVPEFASSYLLPAIAGRARASKALLLGEPFTVAEAEQMGLISETCEDSALDTRADAICAALAANSVTSLRAIKALLNTPEQRAILHDVVDREIELFTTGLQSGDHAEAVRAFFEKRAPAF